MKACLFAKLNNLPVTIVGYHQLKLGPYLRREKVKRKYLGYFDFEKSLPGEWIDRMKVKRYEKTLRVRKDPPVMVHDQADLQGNLFLFEGLPTFHDYFTGLREHRDEVRDLLFHMIRPAIKAELESLGNPVIGVHIRMGDFRKLKEGEAFQGGHVRTPLHYFKDMILGVRSISGKELPVTLFSDGFPDELAEVTALPSIRVEEGHRDLVDLLLLSRSRVLVTTTGSTFSYWAAFLSDASVILHPDHIHAPLRPESVNREHFEGPFQPNNPDSLLLQNIRSI